MIEILVDYVPKNNDIVVKVLDSNLLYGNDLTTGMNYVIFADEHKLTRDDIDLIREHAKTNIKIVLRDNNLIKGMRSGKSLKIERIENEIKMNPFEMAAMFLSAPDREYILNFCLQNNPSLFMPIKTMICAYPLLSKFNNSIVALLDTYQFRVKREILYHMIAFNLKPEPIKFIKWLYPKKEEIKKSKNEKKEK